MQASKLSLMPEGLEEGLTHQDLADLLEVIFAAVHEAVLIHFEQEITEETESQEFV
jgi:hypothetical protein